MWKRGAGGLEPIHFWLWGQNPLTTKEMSHHNGYAMLQKQMNNTCVDGQNRYTFKVAFNAATISKLLSMPLHFQSRFRCHYTFKLAFDATTLSKSLSMPLHFQSRFQRHYTFKTTFKTGEKYLHLVIPPAYLNTSHEKLISPPFLQAPPPLYHDIGWDKGNGIRPDPTHFPLLPIRTTKKGQIGGNLFWGRGYAQNQGAGVYDCILM